MFCGLPSCGDTFSVSHMEVVDLEGLMEVIAENTAGNLLNAKFLYERYFEQTRPE
jgi:hypothetical protein